MILHAIRQGLRAMAGLALATSLAGPLALVCLTAPARADDFTPAAQVNARVITRFELDQRIRMMTVFRQPGDLPKLALQSLIDDTLRRQAAESAGVTVTPDEVQAGMAEFAGRANLDLDKFLAELSKAEVAPETLRDFVEAGLLWRAAVREEFAGKLTIGEAEVDRAIAAGAASGGELRLLLSEIVLPLDGEVDAMALATRLKATATTSKAFSMAAQDFSQAPTARAGGQLGWLDAAALPPELAPTLLSLKVGETAGPIVTGQTVQLYFLRDVSQGPGEAKGPMEVDFARLVAPAGLDLAAQIASLDTCDDLWSLARGLGPDAVQRSTLAQAALPGDLAGPLSRLDPGEATVISGPGAASTLLMLCQRAPASAVPPSRDDVRDRLLNARFGLMATAWLEELRSNALIRIE